MNKNVVWGCFCASKGFALLELLIVVLIIGVLAAVAVPQYQKAVWKSRYVQAKTMATALADGMELYYLANGEYTADATALDIGLTNVTGTTCDTAEKRRNKARCDWYTDWGECWTRTRGQVDCFIHRDGKQFLRHTIFLPHSTTNWKGQTYCFAMNKYKGSTPTSSDLNYQICQGETGTQTPSASWPDTPAFLYR